MEFQKIKNVLDITFDDKNLPRFVSKKWLEVYDQSGRNYNANKEIRTKTSMLRSDLRDFSDVYIVVKGTLSVAKKVFTAVDFERSHNANLNAINTKNSINNAFGEKKNWFLKTMHHLSIVFKNLME